MKNPLNGLAENVIANLVASALGAILLGVGLLLLHDRRYMIAAAIVVACVGVFALIVHHIARHPHKIEIIQLNRNVMVDVGKWASAPLGSRIKLGTSFEEGLALAAVMLQGDQMDNGFWGRTILRYGDLHFRLPEHDRKSYSSRGSLSHCAHALRGLATVQASPPNLQGLYERLWTCRQNSSNGEIYPLDEYGQPVTTNLSEAKHALAAARHTSTGAVSFAFARSFLGGESTSVEHVVASAIRILSKHVDDIRVREEGRAGYTHGYVLEAAVHAHSIGLAPSECKSLAEIMTKDLLDSRSFDAGYWEGCQQKGQEGRSIMYFSALIAERLLWASLSDLIHGVLRRRALDAVQFFLETASQRFTDASGAVVLDSLTKQPDFGTTARCGRLALKMAQMRAGQSWIEYISANTPTGLVDGHAHTHTWEAFLLLGVTLVDEKAVTRIGTRVGTLRARWDTGVEGVLGELLGRKKQGLIEQAEKVLFMSRKEPEDASQR